MNFRDTQVTCQECGKQFIFTVEKQRQMSERGLDTAPPTLCEVCTQRLSYGGRFHGQVKWFNLEKGWGFIVQDDGTDIFVHRDGIPLTDEGELPPLPDGQEVLYDQMDTPKGSQAVKVTLYDSGQSA
jgi:CspA family cold shock protein